MKRNSQPRQLAPLDLERAARGHRIPRGTGRPAKQRTENSVDTEATLHLVWNGPEEDGRKRLLALVSTLHTAGYSQVQMSDGPRTVPRGPQKPRRLQ